MMKRAWQILSVICLALVPALAFAEGAGGGYRGIASMYYFFIGVILVFGVYDVFGKKVSLYAAPVIAIGIYFLLPEV